MSCCCESMSALPGNYSESSERSSEGTQCRLCMKKNYYFYNIFTSNVACRVTVKDALHGLLGLEVAVGDGLPTTLCPLCLNKLTEFSIFKKICLESDGKLRKFCGSIYFRSVQGEEAAVDKLGSPADTKDCIQDVIEGNSHLIRSVQTTEIYIPVLDSHQSRANMLLNLKEESEDPLSEGNYSLMHTTDPAITLSDASDPLAKDYWTNTLTASQSEKVESQGTGAMVEDVDWTLDAAKKEPSPEEIVQGDPVTHKCSSVEGDQFSDGEEEYVVNECTDGASSKLIHQDYFDELNTFTALQGEKGEAEGTGAMVADLDWTLIEAKKEPSLEEDAQPSSGESGDPIESSSVAQDSAAKAFGVQTADGMPIETTSTSYLPAEGSVKNHSTDEFIGATSSVTQIGPKTGASHVGIGRNMMDKDLEKCGNLGTAKLSPCSIPDEWQFKTKDIESLKSIGGGASVTVTGKGGCDAPNTTDNLRLIRISGNDRSGCETIMGDNEKKLNCLINNPGNNYRSNENEKCRDRFKNKSELMEHMKIHSVAHNFDAVAESSIVGVSLEALPSCGYSSYGEPTSSKTLRGLERLETSRKRNDFPKETSGGKGDKKDVRRVSTSFPVEEKSTSQSLSSKSPCTRNLRNRVGARERGRPYSCSVCAKCFTHKGSFDRHVRTHTGERPFPCDACEKSFATKSTLVTHIRTHTGEKPYSCYECKKSFSIRSHLVSHVRTHLGYRPFSCTMCEKSFTRSDCLKLHFRTHTGEKPYICKLCGKSFSRRDILVSHMPTHTGKKLYSCRICCKTFAQRGNLSTHIRNHTGQNLYSCNECERSYSNKNHLVTHIRTHTGEKPYSCCECEKSFSSKSNLNTHIRTHAREKPFSCNECENSFTNKSHFVRHVRTHSEKKPSSSA